MSDFKSVQELILKAAMYDRISTTISADEVLGLGDVIKITFSKGDRHSTTHLDMYPTNHYNEELILHACKSALHRLFMAPYEEIEYVEEN